MKKFFKDFKAFISKGSVLDLAIGMIIGTAFNAIVKSMVNDLLMPIISLMFQGDISDQFFVLKGTAKYVANPTTDVLELVKSSDAVLLFWGRFLQSIIDFLIIGLTLFVIVRVTANVQKRAEERKAKIKAKLAGGEEITAEEEEHVEEEVSEDILLLREIRDSLKETNLPVEE